MMFGFAFGKFACKDIFHPSVRLEEIIAEQLWDYGPVVAIGQPKEADPLLGAARVYVDNDAWQGRVAKLIEGACKVVILPNRTPGVRWELNKVIELGALEKLIVVLPTNTHLSDIPLLWETLTQSPWPPVPALHSYEEELTNHLDKVLVISLSDNGAACCITSEKYDEHSYRIALNVGINPSSSTPLGSYESICARIACKLP